MYLSVLYESEDKEKFFPYTTLTVLYNRDFTIWCPVKTICTEKLPFNFTTFCPFSVFICFVLIWELREFNSLYNINWQVYIKEISPSKAQWSIYFALEYFLSLLRSAHSAYLVDMCLSGKKSIISLNKITRLVYITKLSPSKAQWSQYVPPDYHSTFLCSATNCIYWYYLHIETNSVYFPTQH